MRYRLAQIGMCSLLAAGGILWCGFGFMQVCDELDTVTGCTLPDCGEPNCNLVKNPQGQCSVMPLWWCPQPKSGATVTATVVPGSCLLKEGLGGEGQNFCMCPANGSPTTTAVVVAYCGTVF